MIRVLNSTSVPTPKSSPIQFTTYILPDKLILPTKAVTPTNSCLPSVKPATTLTVVPMTKPMPSLTMFSSKVSELPPPPPYRPPKNPVAYFGSATPRTEMDVPELMPALVPLECKKITYGSPTYSTCSSPPTYTNLGGCTPTYQEDSEKFSGDCAEDGKLKDSLHEIVGETTLKDVEKHDAGVMIKNLIQLEDVRTTPKRKSESSEYCDTDTEDDPDMALQKMTDFINKLMPDTFDEQTDEIMQELLDETSKSAKVLESGSSPQFSDENNNDAEKQPIDMPVDVTCTEMHDDEYESSSDGDCTDDDDVFAPSASTSIENTYNSCVGETTPCVSTVASQLPTESAFNTCVDTQTPYTPYANTDLPQPSTDNACYTDMSLPYITKNYSNSSCGVDAQYAPPVDVEMRDSESENAELMCINDEPTTSTEIYENACVDVDNLPAGIVNEEYPKVLVRKAVVKKTRAVKSTGIHKATRTLTDSPREHMENADHQGIRSTTKKMVYKTAKTYIENNPLVQYKASVRATLDDIVTDSMRKIKSTIPTEFQGINDVCASAGAKKSTTIYKQNQNKLAIAIQQFLGEACKNNLTVNIEQTVYTEVIDPVMRHFDEFAENIERPLRRHLNNKSNYM